MYGHLSRHNDAKMSARTRMPRATCTAPPFSAAGARTVAVVAEPFSNTPTGNCCATPRAISTAPLGGAEPRERPAITYGCGTIFTLSAGGKERVAPANGCGTVFVLEPSGRFSILHSFTGGEDGWAPNSRLIIDGSGNLYGVATSGGAGNDGLVFKISG